MVKKTYRAAWCATTGWLQKLEMCVEIARTHQCDPDSIKDEMLWLAWEAQRKSDKERERRKRKRRAMVEELEIGGTCSQDEERERSSDRECDHEPDGIVRPMHEKRVPVGGLRLWHVAIDEKMVAKEWLPV